MRTVLTIFFIIFASQLGAKETFKSWTFWQKDTKCRLFNYKTNTNRASLDDAFIIKNDILRDVYVFVAITSKGTPEAFGGVAVQGPKVAKSGEHYYKHAGDIFISIDGGDYYAVEVTNDISAFWSFQDGPEIVSSMKRGSKAEIVGKLETNDGEIVEFSSAVDLKGFTKAFNAFTNCVNK